MLRFVLRRLAIAMVLVVGLLTLVFLVLHALPGDPSDRWLDPEADPQLALHTRRALGLDAPLPVQYLRWLQAFLLHRDLGHSFATHRPVAAMLREAVPNTVLLTGTALALRLLLGTTLGTWAAVRRGRRLDRAFLFLALVLHSVPAFWLGAMAILCFAFKLGWFPASGMQVLDHARLPIWERGADVMHHAILPVAVLAVGGVASTARYVRAQVLTALAHDSVRTARAHGIPERRIVLRHALRNAMVPVVNLIGLSLPALVGGALVVETLFAWPGMGRLAFLAVGARDYPVLLATTWLSAVLVVAGSLLADVAGACLDPRQQLT
jgi:peptide/nickel transport system permease protein